MKCPKCQADVPEDSNFCYKCAHDFKKVIATHSDSYNEPQSYTPKFLADKILKTKSSVIGERKLVTVLFADVANYTAMSEKLDPENIHQIMDGCFKILMDEIHEHKGTINQFTGDGVMALFGAPLALEDHAQAACSAALSIQNSIIKYSSKLESKYGLNFQMRIGLNSGTVVVGSIGDDLRMDYTAIGDTTNLAARMESMAKHGTVLVSSNTYQKIHKQFELKSLGETKVKGKEEPLEVYELIKDKVYRPRLGQERQIYSEMVGRDNDLNRLELQVNKAINGEGSVVNIIGEAGIGKSRLIAELKNSNVMKRATLLEGRAISIGRNLSFHPIIDLLKQWAKISEDDSEASSLGKLEAAVRSVSQENANEIIPFVATLMGMKLSGRHAERVKGIEGEGIEKLVLKNVRDLLTKATDLTPLVVVVEDVHWADTSSIELLESLFRLAETQRILFINVFRPDHKETSERIVETIKEKLSVYHVEINLEPLTEKMSETLIDNMLNIKGLHYGIKNKILQRAGGNPFFIEEVVRSFIDEGAVIVKDGNFKVTDKIETMVIPHTINDVLMARIDRLEDETRNLVKVASVIGRNFFHKILSEVAKTVEDIDNRLSHLKEIQLIRERKRMEELEYLFKHALAQEAAYESILHQKRKEIHLQVAKSIEKVFGERLHEFYGMLALHYSKGEDHEKAEENLIKAGEEALKASASSEALHYCQNALELYTKRHMLDADQTKVAALEKNIALAYFCRGNYTESVKYFDKTLQRLQLKEPRGGKIRTYLLLSIKLIILIIYLYLPVSFKKIKPTSSDTQILDLVLKRGEMLSTMDAERMFITIIWHSLTCLKFDLSKSEILFSYFSSMSALFSWPGLSFTLSKKVLDYAKKAVAGQNKVAFFRMHYFVELVHNFLIGDWNKNIRDESIDLALKIGDVFNAASYLYFMGYLYLGKGEYDQVENVLSMLNKINSEFDDNNAKAYYHELNSNYLISRMKLKDALKNINTSISLLFQTGQEVKKIQLLGIKGHIEVLKNDTQSVEKTFEHAELLIKKQKLIPPMYYSFYLEAKALYNLQRLESAVFDKITELTREKEREICLSLTELINKTEKIVYHKVEAYRLMGSYTYLLGKQRKAFKWWDRAIKKGEELGARPDLSRTYMEVGKRLLNPKSNYKEWNGMTAQEYLNKARIMFQEMDLQYDLDELEKIAASY